jgi:hypothetical protein
MVRSPQSHSQLCALRVDSDRFRVALRGSLVRCVCPCPPRHTCALRVPETVRVARPVV